MPTVTTTNKYGNGCRQCKETRESNQRHKNPGEKDIKQSFYVDKTAYLKIQKCIKDFYKKKNLVKL